MGHQLLRKFEPDEALAFQQLHLACQKAALKVETACLAHEQLLMRLQSKCGNPMLATRIPCPAVTNSAKLKHASETAGKKKREKKRVSFADDVSDSSTCSGASASEPESADAASE